MKRVVLPLDMPFELRFWWRVDVRGDDACWPWLAGHDSKDGYGRVFDGERTRMAHVVAWELVNERRVPPGRIIRHTCDNPPCCNGAHLLDGTHTDNYRDARERGHAKIPYVHYNVPLHRRPCGARNGAYTHPESVLRGAVASRARPRSRKLTEADVLAIRQAHSVGTSLVALSRRFGVGSPQIYRIVMRQRWAWLTEEVRPC